VVVVCVCVGGGGGGGGASATSVLFAHVHHIDWHRRPARAPTRGDANLHVVDGACWWCPRVPACGLYLRVLSVCVWVGVLTVWFNVVWQGLRFSYWFNTRAPSARTVAHVGSASLYGVARARSRCLLCMCAPTQCVWAGVVAVAVDRRASTLFVDTMAVYFVHVQHTDGGADCERATTLAHALCTRARSDSPPTCARGRTRDQHVGVLLHAHYAPQHHTPHFVATIASAAPRFAHPAHTLTHPRFAPTTAAPAPTSHPPPTHHPPPPPPPLHRTRRPHPAPAPATDAQYARAHCTARTARDRAAPCCARRANVFGVTHTRTHVLTRPTRGCILWRRVSGVVDIHDAAVAWLLT